MQTAIGDIQFLKSMIPHHSGAILMCERASIQDAQIKELCRTIIQGQRRLDRPDEAQTGRAREITGRCRCGGPHLKRLAGRLICH
jgi:hypothetical protein